MLSLWYLLSALLLGTAITRRIHLHFLPFEAPAFTIAFGLLFWTWLSFLLSLVLPHSLSLPLTATLTTLTSLMLFYRSPAWQWQVLPGGLATWRTWSIFTITSTLLIGWLMWTHDLIAVPNGLYSANATWADFGLHASLISHFAAVPHLPLDFPVAAGNYLTYPFITDLLSAWLLVGGWSLHLAIFIPSILLVTAFLQLMLGFGVRLFRSLGGTIIGLTLALLCGSAVGAFAAGLELTNSHQTFAAFIAHLPEDYSILRPINAQVSNLLADTLLPQRAFLMGFSTFAATIILLLQLRRQFSRPLAIFTAVLIGLLPLVHAHTFVVLSIVVSSFWLETFIKTRRFFNPWLLIIVASLALALPQVLWQTLANPSGTGGHWSPGWILSPGESLWSSWIKNYGLTLPLILITPVILYLRKPLRQYLIWYAPFLAVFILANLYSLQTLAYDNLKLILYAYLFTYIFAGYGIIWLIKRSRKSIPAIIVIILLITTSGALAVLREFQHFDQFSSRDDISLSDWITMHTASTAVFFTTDSPNQPISTLAGRSIVAGYRGWLYSYHINYQARIDDVQLALLGQVTQNNPYHAHYLAVNTYESPEWSIDSQALSAAYQLIYSNPSWKVYQLPQ